MLVHPDYSDGDEMCIRDRAIHRLEGKLQFAKKTLRGALDYLEEEIESDKIVLNKLLPSNNPSCPKQ